MKVIECFVIKNISDLELNKIHILDLHDTKITDASALVNIHTLNLIKTKVKYFGALGRLPNLLYV